MKPEDLAELSSDALLIVRYGRVAYANSAAQALFASCGFAGELVGQRLDTLWEEVPDTAIDATGARRVRTRATPVPQTLEIRAGAAQPGDESGAFGMRVSQGGNRLGRCSPADPAGRRSEQRGAHCNRPRRAAAVFGINRGGRPACPACQRSAVPPSGLRAIAGCDNRTDAQGVRSAIDRGRSRCDTRRCRDRPAAHPASVGAMRAVADPQRLTCLEVSERAECGASVPSRSTRRPIGTSLIPADGIPRRSSGFARMTGLTCENYPEADASVELYRCPGVRTGAKCGMRVGPAGRFALYGRWLIIVVNRDISARYAASQHLQRLQAAMNQAADAIFVADPQRMEYLDANEAAGRLVGLSRQEVLAVGPLGVAKRLSGRTEAEVRAVYQQLIAAHPGLAAEVRQQPTEGGRRVLEWSRRAVQGGRPLAHHQHSPRRDRASTARRKNSSCAWRILHGPIANSSSSRMSPRVTCRSPSRIDRQATRNCFQDAHLQHQLR